MHLTQILRFIVSVFCLFFTLNSHALEVTFVNPGYSEDNTAENSTGNFWYKVAKLMDNAADDLGIKLNVKYANRNHIVMKALIRDAIKDQPDYLILVDEKSVSSDFITKINTHNIPILFLLNPPSPNQRVMLKERGLNIIGSVSPDNRNVGRMLAQALFEEHSNHSDAPANMLALLGDYSTPASIERTEGLMDYVSRSNITLIAKDVANWSENESFIKTVAFLHLAPEINLIWCANDAIAFGAKRALKKLNKEATVKVGGINWDATPKTLKPLDASYGGHVLLGAYALVILYDHHKKPLIWPIPHNTYPIFTRLTAENKALISLINKNSLDDVNFKNFSKTTEHWQAFTIGNLLKELEK